MDTSMILKKYSDGEFTMEEANKELEKIGSNIRLGKKTGNAWIDDGCGGELCTVKDGKIVGGNVSSMYNVYYDGKVYHTSDDCATLVEGKATPETVEKEVLPDEVDRSRHIERANTSVVQKTKKGTYETFYNEDGYAYKFVKV